MRTLTTAQATVESLLAHGVRSVYAVPGVHNDPLFDAFYHVRDRLRVVHARTEQGAAYMALGAALATGEPQVLSVVPGPGLLNASTALLTAHAMSAPVVGLVGQIPNDDIDRGLGHLHELHDQLGLARHIVKHAQRIRAPFEAPTVMAEAFAAALSARRGPVMVECAIDMWNCSGTVGEPEVRAPLRAPVDGAAIAKAAALLAGSKRPLIAVGGGAKDAGAEVAALAEMLEAPVFSFRAGRDVVPSAHRLAMNFPVGHRLWADADVVLAVGSRMLFQQQMWGADDDLAIIRIDIDPDAPARWRPPAAAVVADAADALRELLRVLPAAIAERGARASREAELAAHRAWLADRLAKLEPQMDFLHAIRAALPDDGIFVEDVTQLGFAGRLAFPVTRPRTYFSAGSQDNLGWAYATALGAKAAQPERAVVAVCGDGGFMYHVMELATAVRHGIAAVAVVFDNGCFGNVKLLQEQQWGGRLIANDLTNPDFVALAQSFGVAAFCATTAPELERALRDAFALGKPALVHVPCGEMASPWDMILMPRVRGAGRG